MRRMLPLIALLGLLALAYAMSWHQALSWATLAALSLLPPLWKRWKTRHG